MVSGRAHGVPCVSTSYVGRERETAEVAELLRDGRLVTLTGPGGVGKTRLAVAAASACETHDGSVFVGLAEVRNGDLLPNLVADRLALRGQSDQPTEQAVLDYLSDRRHLLILDNCEHLVEACAAFVGKVLARCPHVVVLASGRQSLGVVGERVVRVAPLAVPPETDGCAPGDIGRYDSVRLFVDRASAVETTFALTEENCAAVASVCRQLDGLPLAIELAAARVGSLSPRQISGRLSLSLLGAGPRTAPERQQTLRATIDWTHDLCSAAEQAVWRRASVFAGSFELDAAEEVCAGPGTVVLDAVEGLLDKSVLLREDHGEVVRYRMLETLREYGHERLAESGELTATERRHRDWIDGLTAQADAEWASDRQVEWVRRLGLEQANLRAALSWSLATPGEAGVALRIASRLDEYWALCGSTVEAKDWLDQALAAAPPDHPDRAVALAVSALHAVWQSALDEAFARLDAAESLPPAPDEELVAAHRTYVRSFASMISLRAETDELAADAIKVFRSHGLVRRELHPLIIYGVSIVYRAGDLEAGRAALRRMLALSEACGEVYYRTMALFGTVMVEGDFGEIDRATAAARTAIRLVREFGRDLNNPYQFEGMAWIASRREHYERSAVLFGAAAALWERFGSAPETAVGLPHKRHGRRVREALGPERFAELHAVGRSFSDDEAARYALEEIDPSVSGEPLTSGEVSEEALTSREVSEEPLTSREREIAEMVTRGLTNREIAARLVISQRTVDTHVQNILVKLGFHNRAQIAAWITQTNSA